MTDEAIDALIVGAGPTGLLMAAELARHGVRPRIIDLRAARSDKSKALALQARTLEILDAIGILDPFLAAGHRIYGINVMADGKRIAHVSTDGLDSPHPYVLVLPQSDTERLLEQHLASLGIRVERETTLIRLAQDDHGVDATLVAAGGGESTCRVPWLIACDGAHSTVRRALGLRYDGADLETSFLFIDARMTSSLLDDEAYAFFSPDGVLLCVPVPALGSDYWRIIASAASEPESLTVPVFETLLAERAGMRCSLLDPQWMTSFTVRQRKVERYRQGRVFLAGDAAHSHSPIGGQGMNTGLQDAYNLAWKLALVIRGHGRAELLDSYGREREPIAASLLQGTEQATRMVTLRNPVAQALRNQVARFLTSLETVQERMVASIGELSLDYRRSPIVAEERAPLLRTHLVASDHNESPSLGQRREFSSGPRAGDRVPDIVLFADAPAERLHQLIRGTGHTLLLFDGDAATAEGYINLGRIARQVTERYGDRVQVHVVVPRRDSPANLGWDGSILHDPSGAVHERFGASAECLYLLRPDGYIGYRSQPADAQRLFRYLETIFT